MLLHPLPPLLLVWYLNNKYQKCVFIDESKSLNQQSQCLNKRTFITKTTTMYFYPVKTLMYFTKTLVWDKLELKKPEWSLTYKQAKKTPFWNTVAFASRDLFTTRSSQIILNGGENKTFSVDNGSYELLWTCLLIIFICMAEVRLKLSL